jgi:hypothetical protein
VRYPHRKYGTVEFVIPDFPPPRVALPDIAAGRRHITFTFLSLRLP